MADTLSIRDNRTGQQYEVPITDGTIRAADLKQVAVDDEPGLATYDPGFVNTASCRSSITYIDGDAGILEYRGYPIEQLAESSTFLEVSYLLLYGELPTQDQLDSWVHEVTYHTFLHENLKQFIQGFRYDAHPGPGQSQAADHSADRQDAHAGRVRLPSRAGQAVHIPGQPSLLHGQLPGHALQDERAHLRGRRATGEGAGGLVHPARRPRAELLYQRRALCRLGGGRPILRRRGRNRRPLRTAAWRGQRGSPQDAEAGGLYRQNPRLHRGREGRQGKADGLRPPGVQELRPTRHDHQEGLRRRLRRHRGQSPAEGRDGAGEDRPRG